MALGRCGGNAPIVKALGVAKVEAAAGRDERNGDHDGEVNQNASAKISEDSHGWWAAMGERQSGSKRKSNDGGEGEG